jgi:hypothetical protein
MGKITWGKTRYNMVKGQMDSLPKTAYVVLPPFTDTDDGAVRRAAVRRKRDGENQLGAVRDLKAAGVDSSLLETLVGW